jgi:hypothetical protein
MGASDVCAALVTCVKTKTRHSSRTPAAPGVLDPSITGRRGDGRDYCEQAMRHYREEKQTPPVPAKEPSGAVGGK